VSGSEQDQKECIEEENMLTTVKSALTVLSVCPFLSTSGCATQQQVLDQSQPTALLAAQNRTQFELNCPTVTTSILSRKMIEPVLPRGIERAEYTTGVDGCGKRSVYMAVCPDASDGNAFAQTGRIVE
jgi:hypothetical protein